MLFEDPAERLPVKACQHANLMWLNISYLAVSLGAEDPPFKFRARQVGEYVCNKSANVRLYRERIELGTVQASSDVAALEIQAMLTISAGQYARRDTLDESGCGPVRKMAYGKSSSLSS